MPACQKAFFSVPPDALNAATTSPNPKGVEVAGIEGIRTKFLPFHVTQKTFFDVVEPVKALGADGGAASASPGIAALLFSEKMTPDPIRSRFSTLREPELLAYLHDLAHDIRVEAGQTVLRIGQHLSVVPLVLEGTLRVERQDEEGNELFLYHVQAGQTCAMSLTGCLFQETSKIQVVAEEPSQLRLVPARLASEWMSKYESWKEFVVYTYSQRYDELIAALDAVAFRRVDERLVRLLRMKAEALHTDELQVTHQELAEALNTSREVVSRLLKTLERQGAIRLTRNRLKIIRLV